jgi:prophage regulatory protein
MYRILRCRRAGGAVNLSRVGYNVLAAEPHATMPVSSHVLLGPGSDAAGLADRTVTADELPSSVAEHRASGARVLRLPQVCHRVGLCRSMIYRLESEGRFPRRVKLGVRAVGWIESEVESWIRGRAERSHNDMRTETQ